MERKNGLINLISGDDALQAINIVSKMAFELLALTKQHKEIEHLGEAIQTEIVDWSWNVQSPNFSLHLP
jgi:hypothetical protein